MVWVFSQQAMRVEVGRARWVIGMGGGCDLERKSRRTQLQLRRMTLPRRVRAPPSRESLELALYPHTS